ncbi:MAG: hypothetical protein HQL52_08075 [Magnetococcales bacterium]|nr:hypothetical protein [Magnetococcales bacterium]
MDVVKHSEMMAEIETILRKKKEILLADLAIELMLAPEEVRGMVAPLMVDGRVECLWQPRKTLGCKLCGCDNEEYLRWVEA